MKYLVCVKIFHKAKLQAFVKMQISRNQPKTFQNRRIFQRYVSRTATKVNATNTRLDLLTAS